MEGAAAVSRGMSGGGRWIVLGVVVPVLVGLGATLTLWQGLDHDVVQAPAAAEPALLHNGPVLILSPLTATPMMVAVGQQLEVQVANQRGLSVSVANADVLATIAQTPCRVEWPCPTSVYVADFVARHPGVASMVLDYGTGCVPTPCRAGVVVKAITVLARPQTRPLR